MELKINKKGQMKIQQMAFMIIAVFLFFSLAGLFLLRIQFNSLYEDADNLNRDQAISSLKIIANSPELNCGSNEYLCLDEDKLRILSGEFGKEYKNLWPVSSIEVYKIYPSFSERIECPNIDCNYYKIHESNQRKIETASTFISICKRVNEEGIYYNKCEIGKLLVGIKSNDK